MKASRLPRYPTVRPSVSVSVSVYPRIRVSVHPQALLADPADAAEPTLAAVTSGVLQAVLARQLAQARHERGTCCVG